MTSLLIILIWIIVSAVWLLLIIAARISVTASLSRTRSRCLVVVIHLLSLRGLWLVASLRLVQLGSGHCTEVTFWVTFIEISSNILFVLIFELLLVRILLRVASWVGSDHSDVFIVMPQSRRDGFRILILIS